jgi:ketosteroid isomerase-like protein
MKIIAVALTTILAIAISPSCAIAQTQRSDPLSVLKSLLEMRNATDTKAALALFADDGVIVNVVGANFAGRDNMKKLIQDINAETGRYELEDAHSEGDTVTWTDLATNPIYEKLGVAPVQIAGRAVIRDGKIKSFITHFPSSSLAKFEQACEQKGCETPKADGVLIVGQPCLRFLANAWAQTRRAEIQ